MCMCKCCERNIVKQPCTKGNTDGEGCVQCTETFSSAEVQQLLSHRACALGQKMTVRLCAVGKVGPLSDHLDSLNLRWNIHSAALNINTLN